VNELILVASAPGEKPENYVRALARVGVAQEQIRVLMPAEVAPGELRPLAAQAAGLVLSGGADVDPRHYGEEPMPEAWLSLEPERDAMELELLTGARDGHAPVWGVCRGLQVLNVFLGGTLWQDLPTQRPGTGLHQLGYPADALVHEVLAKENRSWLGQVLARERALVNSRHHQGIKALAPALAAVGFAPDGLVEAVAGADPTWWVHGVQWHPENLVDLAQERALWEGFVAQTRARAPRTAAIAP
jgi:putative glutamine amidotransferase